jgi:hypothetical protein
MDKERPSDNVPKHTRIPELLRRVEEKAKVNRARYQEASKKSKNEIEFLLAEEAVLDVIMDMQHLLDEKEGQRKISSEQSDAYSGLVSAAQKGLLEELSKKRENNEAPPKLSDVVMRTIHLVYDLLKQDAEGISKRN